MIEAAYEKFLNDLEHPFNSTYVDCVGLDISDVEDNEYSFKLYYTEEVKIDRNHYILSFLDKRNMIRAISPVEDGSLLKDIRLDIQLMNRNNQNIYELFDFLEKNSVQFKAVRKNIEYLSRAKITNWTGYDFSSLYHLGFVEKSNLIEKLKIHFILYDIENPDKIHQKIVFQEAKNLDYIKCMDVNEFRILAKVIEELLPITGGNLWIAGWDIDINNRAKYKIYIVNPVEMYSGIENFFQSKMPEKKNLIKKMKQVKSWRESHPKIKLGDFAVCLDSNGKFSINYYHYL